MINLGAKFSVSQPVHLLNHNGNQVIVVGNIQANKDVLDGVPII